MSHLLALDQGTSSSKAIIFNLSGRVVGAGQHEFDNIFPADGWVEQDPEVLWRTTLLAGREALASAGLKGEDIAAIGITNQRETTLVWDRQTGRCLHNAIVWQDRRTADRCELMRLDGLADAVAETTGLIIDPYFSATKLAWLLDNVAGSRERAETGALAFGTVDTYLVSRLTKGQHHATDASNASRTMLFDIAGQTWSERLLNYFNIPAALLPEVRDSAGDFGVADPEWFGAPIPICGIAGDQQAALIGQGCFNPGMAKSTYGTGCFAMINTGTEQLQSQQQLLTTIAYRLSGSTTYALEGSIFSAGVAVKWLRDQLGLVVDAADTEAAAVRAQGDTAGVFLVPAFTGLGAPHWAPEARGLVAGLTLATTRDQLITATLQSVAFQSHELIAAMACDGAVVDNLRVDGGMVVNDWLCQCLADVVNLPVERPEITETTALGAAILAALGAGLVEDLDAAARLWNLEREFLPAMDAARRESLLKGWHAAVARTLL
ncbi:MAG: glycerol kinase GlpK [Pseudomonadales bacterium]|nr:glycerol kinase GlpK [Pseudomonadales bacterium]NIX06513.1 glycerol kinase GlpK [Pseudomonadales bacterium]